MPVSDDHVAGEPILAADINDLAALANTTETGLAAELTARAAADTALDGRVDTLEAEQGGSRPPSGGAGGVLSGSYPNPGFAADMATQAELNTAISGLSGTYVTPSTGVVGAAPSLLLGDPAGMAPKIPYLEPSITRTPVERWQSGHGWSFLTQDATSNLNNTSSPPIGTQYMSIVTQGLGVGTPARGRKTGYSTMDWSGKIVWLLLRVGNVAKMNNIQITAGNGTFTNYYLWQIDRAAVAPSAPSTSTQSQSWFREGEWTWIGLDWGNNTGAGSPSPSNITDLQISVFDDGTGKVTVDAAAWATSPDPKYVHWPNGVVTFSCDDNWATQYTLMRPILDGYLMPATANLICDVLAGSAALGGEGSMTVAQVQRLQAANGWEPSSHSYSLAAHNAGYTTLTDAQLESEFALMKQYLKANDLHGSDHWAVPLGDFNPTVLHHARRYFTSVRTIQQFRLETFPPSDRFKIRALALNSGTTLATAKLKVDDAYANGTWLVFTCHRLDNSTADSKTWVTSDFQSLVDYIAAKGIPVRTMSQVMSSRGQEAMRQLPTLAQAQGALSLSAVIRSGAATVANNVLPPGVRIGYPCTLTKIVVRAGTAPTGSGLTVRVNLDGVSLGTTTIAAAGTSATSTISTAATAGQILTYDITAIGSTVAGSDIAVDVVGS